MTTFEAKLEAELRRFFWFELAINAGCLVAGAGAVLLIQALTS